MKTFVFIFSAWLLSSVAFAQSISPAMLAIKVDSLVANTIKDKDPGGVVGVIFNHQVVFKKAYGLMSLEYNLPNTETTTFNLASVSKQFTAYAILLLEQEGKLKLDDDVHQYLSWLPDYGQKITLRHLLHHTSGIPPSDNLKLFAGISLETPWTTEDEIDLMKRYSKLNFTPNDEHLYSNAGYFLLAQVVEKVSGQPFGEFMKGRIFEPLGMKNSFIYDTPGKVMENKASFYKKTDKGYKRMFPESDSYFGETNLYTSLNDMLLWCENLLDPKVGTREMNNRIFNPTDKTNKGDTISYTYGFYTGRYKGLRRADHSGSSMGVCTQMMVFPDQQFAVFVLSNNESMNIWDFANKIADWSLAGFITPEKPVSHQAISIDKSLLAQYEGSFEMGNGMRLTFKPENDTLRILLPDNVKLNMYPEREDKFFLKEVDAQCTFVKKPGQPVSEICWRQGNQDFKGIKVAQGKPIDITKLDSFAGSYFSETLHVGYPIRYENNKLIMKVPSTFKTYIGIDTDVELYPMDGDRFQTSSLGIVAFERDKGEKITGFKFCDVGRVRNIEFSKR
jgi:CubicO group peptidase (beta-lactamase class C family)